MKINSKWIGIISILVIFGGILIADISGFWITESTKVPVKVEDGEFKGQFDPADIRGSYTFKDIENSFDVPVNVLAQSFRIKADNIDEFQVKNLESIYTNLPQDIEIGTGSVKYFVSLYTGIHTVDGEYLPKSAIETLFTEGKINDIEKEELLRYTIDIQNTEYRGTTHEEEGFVISGETTIKEIIENGVEKEKLEEIIGTEITDTNSLIKTLSEQNGLKFGRIKNAIYDLLEVN